MQNVADRGTRGRGDDADTPGQPWQAAFAGGVEQSLELQFGAQFLELPLQCTEAGVFHVVDHELEFPTRLVQPNAGPHQYLLAVPRRKGRKHVSLPEHGASDLRGGVLEREIPMTRSGPREIGYLRLQPKAAESALEQHPNLAIEP